MLGQMGQIAHILQKEYLRSFSVLHELSKVLQNNLVSFLYSVGYFLALYSWSRILDNRKCESTGCVYQQTKLRNLSPEQ